MSSDRRNTDSRPYPIPRIPIIIVGGTIYRNYTGGPICFSIARELTRFSTSVHFFFFVFPSFPLHFKLHRLKKKRKKHERKKYARHITRKKESWYFVPPCCFSVSSFPALYARSYVCVEVLQFSGWRKCLQVELFREIRLDFGRVNIQVESVSHSAERLRHCTLGGS